MKVKKWFASLLVFILVAGFGFPLVGAAAEAKYEVWLADQGTQTIHIYDQTHKEIDTIDFKNIGTKPHMLVFDEQGDYAYVANMGTGTVSVIRASDRKVLATLETAPGAHAALPSPDGKTVLVANTPSQSISKIVVDKENEKFTVERTIDLTKLKELSNDKEFPNRNPICIFFTPDGKKAYVTIGGGGLVILDAETLEVVQAFGKSIFGAHGCGLIVSPDGKEMYATSGSTTSGHYYSFDIATDSLTHKASSEGLDTHGVAFTPDGSQLWLVNRVSDDVTIMDVKTKKIVDKIDYVGDAPDLISFSPDGKYAYISLRGPEPATGTHNMAGNTPGLAIIDVEKKKLKEIIPINTKGTDPHGLDVRVISAPEVAPKIVTVKNVSKEIVVGKKTIKLPVAVNKSANGEALVSARAVTEALGGSVYWNAKERAFVLQANNQFVKFTIGSDTAVVNGRTHKLQNKVSVVNGHSQVPASFLFELFGYTVK
ncbi:hypothetical protein DS745_05095 [Anaerobacillus alkaliphilus]|uniref:Copper amine oxidase-like N-terminal domain-containing protein n=1 Tax=Anaerobacillus alkaliphilus TaxID=1548597 RepID=A0A4Q0VVL6_9BACI|nr:stalk domain-containing protein [Anaerobacillus alkaliphilus]RXJ02961.1 hypothetical protein DS745_05095 [Anaerobacillus alkaliphilus]